MESRIFRSAPQPLSIREYELRRDECTAAALAELYQSPEFKEHQAARSRRSYWKRLGTVSASLLIACSTIMYAAGVFTSNSFAHQIKVQPTVDYLTQKSAELYGALTNATAQLASQGHRQPGIDSVPKDDPGVQEGLPPGIENLSALLKALETELKYTKVERDVLAVERNVLWSAQAAEQHRAKKADHRVVQLEAVVEQMKLDLQAAKNLSGVFDSAFEDDDTFIDPEEFGDEETPSLAAIGFGCCSLLLMLAMYYLAFLLLRTRRQLGLLSATHGKVDAGEDEKHGLERKSQSSRRHVLENKKLRAELESQAQELAAITKQLEEKGVEVEIDQANLATIQLERDLLISSKEALEAELRRLKQQLSAEADRNAHPDPHDPNSPHFQAKENILSPEADGGIVPTPPTQLYEEGRGNVHANAGGQPGKKNWSELSERVTGMRSQLSKSRKGDDDAGVEKGKQAHHKRGSTKEARSTHDIKRITELERDNTWLKEQNVSLEAQLDQVTSSLADFADKKASAASTSFSQTRDLEEMAIVLARKEDDNNYLEAEVSALRQAVQAAWGFLSSKEEPTEEELVYFHNTLHAHHDKHKHPQEVDHES